MARIAPIVCLLALCLSTRSFSQTSELVQYYTFADIEEAALDFGIPVSILPIEYEVILHRVSYYTEHPNGDSVLVSGALAFPANHTCPSALSSYQHGTVADQFNVPSFQSDETLLGVLYASAGIVTTMPDFIGLGLGEGRHLYVHAESQAETALDLIRAAHTLQDDLGYALDDQLFLWGYSQGGHATMALHRKIELEVPEEFTVTACAPMSGPYDISGVQADIITSDSFYPTPGYLPYVVMSYQEVYGNLYDDVEDLFVPEFASEVEGWFQGDYSMDWINNQCPNVPSQMLHPAVLDDFENNPDNPIRLALQDNDVYDWAPQAPTRLYYCEGDDQVSFENSELAFEVMTENGAANLSSLNGGDLDHSGCAPLAMMAGFNWFLDLRQPFFQPEIEAEVVQPGDGPDGLGSISISEDQIDASWTLEWSNGQAGGELVDLDPGLYVLTISNDSGCALEMAFNLYPPLGVLDRKTADVHLYPNPANGILHVGGGSWEQAQVRSTTGQVVLEAIHFDGKELNVSTLAPGMYSLVLRSNEAYASAVFCVQR